MKAACKEWLDTFGIGALNGTATDKLVAVLDGVDCPMSAETLLRIKISWLRSPSGYSAVTDGLTISVSAA